jgi:prevent-host-death family protein
MKPRKPVTPVVRKSVSLFDAKAHLSSLVERAAAGEEFVITKSGKPQARLMPLAEDKVHRRSGQGKGRWRIASDFDGPLPDDVLNAFWREY